VEIKKQYINSGKTVFDSQVKATCDGSIIVPDVKSDIIKVLQVEADTYLCDKTVEDGKVTLTGTVNVTVLYTPENEESLVCAIHGCFNFCEVIKRQEFADGMKIMAVCDADKVTYKLINSRKIGIEAQVMINVQVVKDEAFECICDIDGEDAECRYQNVNLCSIGSYKEYSFGVEESFSIPAGKPEISEILKGNVIIQDKEYKALTDKVVIKGRAVINALYSGSRGEIEHFGDEAAFTEVVDMPGICEDAECDITYETGNIRLSLEGTGETGQCINVTFDVICGIKTENEQSVTTLCDCYFTDANEELEYIDICADETVARPRFHTLLKEVLTKKDGMPEISGVYSAVAKPYVESVKVQGNKIMVGGKVVIYVLYTSDNAQVPVCSISENLPLNCAIECDALSEGCDILLKGECEHISTVICSDDAVEVRCAILICGRVVKRKNVRMISDAKKGDCLLKESGILVYFAQKNDTVWDVAKKYRVPEHCVYDAMQDCDRLKEGMKIIIPVSR